MTLIVICSGLGFLSRGNIIWQLTISYSETGDFEGRRYLYRVAVTSDHFNSQFFTNQKHRTARDSLLRTISLLCSQISKFSKMKCCSLNLKIKFQEYSISWMWDGVYLSVTSHQVSSKRLLLFSSAFQS